ncbi:MAG: oligosaccharide flippase family protein [Ardenticatenaceae bacterium]|nr:oligosaccharide flippase family protein [Ardenticatenaceae bacterium]
MTLQSIWHRFVDPVTRNWLIHFSGNLGRLALGMVSSVLIARALSPDLFGAYILLGAVSSIGLAVANMGLPRAAVQQIAAVWEHDPGLARQRGRVFFGLQVVGATAVLLLLVMLIPILADSLLSIERYLVSIVLVGVLAMVLSGTMNSLLQATGQFGRLSFNLLLNSGLTSLLAIWLFWRGQLTLINALLILGVATSLVSFVVGYWLLPPALKAAQSPLPWQPESTSLLRLSRWFWLSSLLAILATRADILLIGRLSESSTVGWYGLAANLAAKAEMINHSLYAVLLPAAAAIQNPNQLHRYLTQSTRRGLLVCVGLLLALVVAQPLIPLFYGAAYDTAVPFFRWLLLLVMVDVITTPFLLLAFAFDRPHLITLNDALRLTVLVPLTFWFLPTYGAMGIIGAKFIAQIIAVSLTLVLLWRKRPYLTPAK